MIFTCEHCGGHTVENLYNELTAVRLDPVTAVVIRERSISHEFVESVCYGCKASVPGEKYYQMEVDEGYKLGY